MGGDESPQVSQHLAITPNSSNEAGGELGEAGTSRLQPHSSLLAQPLPRQPLLAYLFVQQLALEGDSGGWFCLGARIYISERPPPPALSALSTILLIIILGNFNIHKHDAFSTQPPRTSASSAPVLLS